MINKPKAKLPNPEKIDRRFHFISDDILRENISNAFSFIIFLDSIENELQLPDLYKTMIYKTMIIYSASIVESLLFYKLSSMFKNNKIKEIDVLGDKIKYKEISKVLLNIKSDNPIFLCEKISTPVEIKPSTHFHKLIIYAKRCGLLSDTLFRDCNTIKDLRNNLHMSAMTRSDNSYSREDVNDVFTKVRKISNRIENF